MRALVFIGVMACAPAWSAVALAQPVNQEMNTIARNHFDSGSRYFGLRRFDDAAREFLAAYELSGRRELLFNLGRSYESGGRLTEALDAYERYAASLPAGQDRSELDHRMSALRERLFAATPSHVEPVGPVAPPRAEERPGPTVRPVAPPPRPRRDRIAPVVLTVAGGVALVAALGLGLTVASTHSDLTAQCPGGLCPPSLEAEADGARTRALVADLVGGVGLAAVIAGVVWWLVPGGEGGDGGRAPRVTVGCASSGCAGSVGVAF